MIEFELLRDRGVLVLSPNGPLEKADFERLAQAIDPFIAANGKLTGLMICAEAFPGWDSFGALEVRRIEAALDFSRTEFQRAQTLSRTQTISARMLSRSRWARPSELTAGAADVVSGLAAGDRVIMHPSDRVIDGSRIAQRGVP